MTNLARTSVTHPLRVDWIDSRDVPEVAGRLGLTFAPGKYQTHALTGRWERDLEADLTRLRDHWQTACLVTLIEPFEFEELRIQDLRRRATELGMESLHFPIPDRCAPDDQAALLTLCATINERLADRQKVVVHCKGGLGRAGLVAATCIIGLGYSPAQAIGFVRRVRTGAIETRVQEQLLEGLESGWWRST